MSRPGLWERLDGRARVTVVSAPPGSGKTVLLRSWIGEAGLVAEHLLAEVLDLQPAEARRLLLRTSVLGRVNGELADLLTGGSGRVRVRVDLEEANAFVVSLDAARSWFRYHHLFADLLQLELRRTEPGEVAARHELAPGGSRGTGSRWRRSGMPGRRGTGGGPPGCWPTTGPACIWPAGPRPCTRS